jgi:ABC-type amino acid transport substrate-binding protein
MKKIFSSRLKLLFRTTMLLALAMVSYNVRAAPVSPTLEHIKQSNSLNIGYRQIAPFSLRDKDGKVSGYTITLCNLIADELRHSPGLKNLAIHYIPVLFTDRVSALNSSKIDMDCSVNTDAPERKSSVSFSLDYYVANMRIVSLGKNNIRSLNDLKGHTVSVPRGSKDLLELNRVNREKHLSLSIKTSDTVEDAFNMMAQHRTAAVVLDDVLVYPFINQSEHPEDFTVSHEIVGDKMKYAIMMKKQDAIFVSFVDKTLERIIESPKNTQLISKLLVQKVVIKNKHNN